MFINYSLLIILFSHATCLHTRLTEFFLNYVSSSQTTNLNLAEPQLPALSCLLYHKGHQSDERTCNIMFLLSQNFYKCKQAVYCVFCYVCPCRIVVACLFVYPLFLYYTLLLPVYFLIPFLYRYCCCFFIPFLYWLCCYIFIYSLSM